MQDFVSENYYDILGVDRSAPFEVIKKAYRKKVISCHPDHHQGDKRAEEQFKKVSIAYKILQDPEKRRHYDVVSSTLGGSISNNPVINDFVNAFKHIINDVTDDFNQEFKAKTPPQQRRGKPAPKKSDGHIHLKQGGVSFKIKRA